MMEKVVYDMSEIDVVPCKYDEDYLVYSNGMIYSSKRERFLNAHHNGKKSKYLWVSFYNAKTKKYKKHYLHRLVAEHFLPNPNNLRDVHHQDSNPRNNDVSNLQWLSHQDNCKLTTFKKNNPFKQIEKNDMAYIGKEQNYWVFCYRGMYHDIPKIKKYLKSVEEAKEFRDNYLLVNDLNYSCVA